MALLVHQQQTVEQFEDLRAGLVDHHEDDPALQRELLQQVHDVLAVAAAEAARGLVHEEHAGFTDELQRNVEAFALAAADGLLQRAADLQVLRFVEAQGLQQAHHALADLLVGLIAEAELGVEEEVLINGELLDEQVVLAHVADHAADAIAIGMDIDAVDGDTALARLEVAVEHVEQCALAAAAAAHDANELAARFGHVQFMQSHASVGECVLDAVRLEHEPFAAFAVEEAREDVAVIDRLAVRWPHGCAVVQDIRLVAVDGLSVQQHAVAALVAHQVQAHARHMEHAHFAFEAMRMQVVRTRGGTLLRGVDVEQVRRVLALQLGFHEDLTALEFAQGDVERLGHGAHELLLLVTHFPACVDQLEQVDQHDELLALGELLVHLRADLQDLHAVEACAFPALLAGPAAGMKSCHESLEDGHVGRRLLQRELLAQEARNAFTAALSSSRGAVHLRDDREQLQ